MQTKQWIYEYVQQMYMCEGLQSWDNFENILWFLFIYRI